MTPKKITEIGNKVGINWEYISGADLKEGIEYELSVNEGETVLSAATIAKSHLEEFPDFYKQMKKMKEKKSNFCFESKWRSFMAEVESPVSTLVEYEAHMVLTIQKRVEGMATNSMKLIRAIPSVTTISKEVSSIENEEYTRGLYVIKFVLENYDNVTTYYDRVLKPSINKIPGVRIIQDKGFRKKLE